MIALREVNFTKATLRTQRYECIIYKLTKQTCKVEMELDGKRTIYEDGQWDEDGPTFNAEDKPNEILQSEGSSIFLPTFRRIEGGFTIGQSQNIGGLNRISRAKNDIEESLATLSRGLSHNSHTFVASISTADIVALLTKQYSDLSDRNTHFQQVTSQEIISKIKKFRADQTLPDSSGEANSVLDSVSDLIQGMENRRIETMRPFEEVKSLIATIFQHQGIKFHNRLSFGDAASAINSESLSAGEKQMLSFICYNAFYRNSTIIIDEPELSLHVDWQRQLFPILQRQQSSNQFIFATHSPFIYNKYFDKEIRIDPDRGGSVGDSE